MVSDDVKKLSYIDDVCGWDFYNDDASPFDDHGHGTHCAGTIGASNNGSGVVGVCWQVRMAALKFLGGRGSGLTSDAVDAINYATAMQMNLTSNSWGGGAPSLSLEAALAVAQESGLLFVVAAGNDSEDGDISPHWPASYPHDIVLSVAASDHRDMLAGFSNYGIESVDLAAPGASIYSCTRSRLRLLQRHLHGDSSCGGSCGAALRLASRNARLAAETFDHE